MKEVIHFNSMEERLAYLKHGFEEIKPEKAEKKPAEKKTSKGGKKAAKKGAKKDEVSAE